MRTEPERIHELLDTLILTRVSQPGQYTGGEPGSVRKDPDSVEVSLALCFPDAYTVGMSNLGYQILYSIVNSMPWAAAERAYAPSADMQEQMKEHGIPLFTVEGFRPVSDFDLAGFTLQSELLYSNILLMLDLAGIPLRRSERGGAEPLVIAGGPGAMAPEPLAEFIDLFFVGDAEESLPEFLGLYRRLKARHAEREEVLREAAAEVRGVYAPGLYRPRYGVGGALETLEPLVEEAPMPVRARRVKDLDSAPFPTAPVVPLVETAHERINLEIMRGCGRGCRFCHAGMTNRPGRLRSPDTLVAQAIECYKNTGYDEIALSSLSSSDYPHMPELLERLTRHFTPLGVSISLPSLRVSDRIEQLVGPLNAVRKSGLTLAPEAATQRLRDLIRKDITDDDLYSGTAAAARAGWKLIKLYFMVGLPGEQQEDIDAIGDLCNGIIAAAGSGGGGKPLSLNVTISPFVPKPHTPLQWQPMEALESLLGKWERIRLSGGKRLRYKWHDPRQSVVEAALARGDRRMGDVLLDAYVAGAQFDAWNDRFRFDIWKAVLESHGLPVDAGGECGHPNSPFRARGLNEHLPWDHIDCGVGKDFLCGEREKALTFLHGA